MKVKPVRGRSSPAKGGQPRERIFQVAQIRGSRVVRVFGRLLTYDEALAHSGYLTRRFKFKPIVASHVAWMREEGRLPS